MSALFDYYEVSSSRKLFCLSLTYLLLVFGQHAQTPDYNMQHIATACQPIAAIRVSQETCLFVSHIRA